MFRVINSKTGRVVPNEKFHTQVEAEAFLSKKGSGFELRGGYLARATALLFEKRLDNNSLGNILDVLRTYLGDDAGFTRTAENEITVINFCDDKTKVPFGFHDEDFMDKVLSFAEINKAELGISETGKLWTEGEYGETHEWANDNKGDTLLIEGILRIRPDLHAWLRDRRDAFEKLIENYSGEKLVAAERSAISSNIFHQSGTQSGRANLRGRAIPRVSEWNDQIKAQYGTPREGSSSVVGVHFSPEVQNTLSGAFYGKGLKGAEASRVGRSGDPRLANLIATSD